MDDFFSWIDGGVKWLGQLVNNADKASDPDAKKVVSDAKDAAKELTKISEQSKQEQARLKNLEQWRKKHEQERKAWLKHFKQLERGTSNKDMKAIYQDRQRLINGVYDNLNRDNLRWQEDIRRKNKIRANSVQRTFRKHQNSLSQAKRWSTIRTRTTAARSFVRQASSGYRTFRKGNYQQLQTNVRKGIVRFNTKAQSMNNKPHNKKKLKAYSTQNLRKFIGGPPR